VSQPIIFFDGVCGLCNRFVKFVIRCDKKNIFRFAALQDFQEKLPKEFCGEMNTVIVLSSEKVYLTKSDAVLYVFGFFGLTSKALVMSLQLIPKGFRDWIYDTVARNRYDWFGKQAACLLPDDSNNSRFLRKDDRF